LHYGAGSVEVCCCCPNCGLRFDTQLKTKL
jgi:hypothetical protein